jgi:hypothetical protein
MIAMGAQLKGLGQRRFFVTKERGPNAIYFSEDEQLTIPPN